MKQNEIRIRRSQEDLIRAAAHVCYEVEMLHFTATELGKEQPRELKNVLIESFATHLRNLTNFIWPDMSQIRSSDIIAADFLKENQLIATCPDVLKCAVGRTAKEIAHLTYIRLDVGPEEKNWDFQVMAECVSKGFQEFLDALKLQAEQHRELSKAVMDQVLNKIVFDFSIHSGATIGNPLFDAAATDSAVPPTKVIK